MSDGPDPEALPSRTDAVAQALGHALADQALLARACTHASRCGAQASTADKLRAANERLEFIGDALLGAARALLVFERFPEADEGQLSRLRARLASRAILARAIERLDLLRHCLVGSQMGEPWPDSVKANLMESLFAAVFLDGGWPALRIAVERALAPFLDDPESGRDDPRMRLQAWCLEHHKRLPDYTCERSGGTDHEPRFTATAAIAGMSASGSGSSRRRAEATAAEELLSTLAPS
ncbi:MAG: ribonuclease III family protein [Planctomycetes bacterium]|nr:ribonuclease III family protein [Planctomycetota bacterium]